MTIKHTKPSKHEVYNAMMDSLIDSFQVADDAGGRLIVSMNYGDIADMLHYFKREANK